MSLFKGVREKFGKKKSDTTLITKAVERALEGRDKKKKKKKKKKQRSPLAVKKGEIALKAETEKYGKRFGRKMGGSTQSRRGYTPAVMMNHENYNDSIKRKYGGKI
tara:strand:- start:45 stop:362 length:318 start_codon:yes stop_codon:yes gene_type:complete